jgi:hypothetical protein
MQALIENEVHRQQAIEFLKAVVLNGKRKYLFVLKLFHRPRTIKQNRLLHLWIRCISEEVGFDHYEVHEYLKRRFLTTKQICIGEDDPGQAVPLSTKKMAVEDFTNYLDRIKAWATDDLGIVLPTPDTIGFDNLIARYGEEV